MGRIVIIGGGAVGLGLAWQLGRRGAGDVVLLERNRLTSGTSWHAAGIVGPLRATANMTRLAMEALTAIPALEAETGMATGYRRTGGYWLARVPERMDELHRIAALGHHMGLTPEVVTGAPDVPGLAAGGIVGALAVTEDAQVDPVGLCMAYARAARALGVEIREGAEVSRVVTTHGAARGVALADGSVIGADLVALCAGAWSGRLVAQAGVTLPLQAVEHMYVVTEPVAGLPRPFPVLRDLDAGIYVKGDAGRLVIGGFEPDAKCWDAFGPEADRPFLELAEDWDQFAPFMQAALRLIPALETTGIQRFLNGPESFTHDTRPLIGETPEVDGLFVAAGMNSVGVMSSAGVGRALAGWMLDGAPAMDLWEADIARADPRAAAPAHMAARMAEAVADQFALHWPYRQPRAGRGLRRSVLHECWAGQGAVFGVTAGWERGLWYARDAAERELPYAVGAQPWWPFAAREAAVMAEGAALIDLSPLAKFDIAGPGALAYLERVACARIDRPVGRAVYTPLLNASGGIEADVTITRLARDRFRLTSGAATRWRDGARLRRLARGFDVTIADVTEAEAVIGVMGGGARALLAQIADGGWSDFPFSTARDIRLGPAQGDSIRATRLSYVGEPGWELAADARQGRALFERLIAGGARPMGHYAVDACRIEKGFLHWGHDIGPEVTPLEAGLGFAVDRGKDFIGRAALDRQRAEGLGRRLMLFQAEGEPLLLHDEPIRERGRVVGLTTSGARGARTGKALALGLIAVEPGETRAETCARRFEIEVAGRRYRARALAEPPFDPGGERMRA